MQIERTAALVADDHELFRSGFSVMLKRDCGFTRVIETSTLDEGLQALGECADITFASFDLAMPGVESALSLQSVREVFPNVCMVVVTGSKRREDMLLALTAGAHGYVLKTWSTAEITSAVEMILDGHIFVPRSIADLPHQTSYQTSQALEAHKDGTVVLTPRQQDVLQLIRTGRSTKEIARMMNLAESTVKVHTNALYKALGVHNRSSAAAAKPK
jgi:DNA-binding NarL/FixJ family response regulator